MSLIKMMLVMVSVAAISKTFGLLRFLLRLSFLAKRRLLPHLLTLWVCKLLMLICILTKNVITSCSVTMMLFLHLEVKPLMTLTTVLYLSCALISGHLAMMLMELKIGRAVQQECRDLHSFPTRRSSDLTTSTTSIDIMGLQAAYANLHTDQERDYFMQRYHDVISSFGGKTSYDADNRPLLVMRSNLWASGYDVDGTDQTSLGQ